MSSPQVTPNQDDLMNRLQAVSSSGTTPNSNSNQTGDDLISRLQAATGTTPVNMVGPNGEKTQVPPSQVADMRTKNYAVAPESGVLVSNSGTPGNEKTMYVTPDELPKYYNDGYKRSLTPEEDNILRSGDKSNPKFKEAQNKSIQYESEDLARSPYFREQLMDKAIGGGVVVAAPVVAGAANGAAALVAPTVIPVGAAAPFGGVGPSLLRQGVSWAGKKLAEHAMAATIGGSSAAGVGIIGKMLGWWKN